MGERILKRQTFIVNTAYLALVAALILLAVRFLVPWLLPFIMGYAIAIVLRPMVRFLTERWGAPSKLAGFVVVILAYALIGLLLTWGGVRLVTVIRGLFADLPAFYEYTLEPAIHAAGVGLSQTLGGLFPQGGDGHSQALILSLEDFRGALLALSATVLNFLGTLGTNIPGFLLGFLFTIMSSLIISMNYTQVTGFLSCQIPEKHRALFFRVKNDAFKAIGSYLLALLKIMGITFLELAIGLSVLGVQNAPFIALGIAIFDAFPVLGVGGILIPWAILELLRGGFPLGFGLLVLYGIVVVVRGFVEPRIIGVQLGLHPLVTLCAIYAGFQLMGVLGMIFFPIAAQILVRLHRSGILTLWIRP